MAIRAGFDGASEDPAGAVAPTGERPPGAPVRPPGSAQSHDLADVIRRQIFAGELLPGELLSQKAVAASLGVSRIPVREALRVLDGEGLIVNEPGVGTRVRLFDTDGLRELYEIRQQLEGTLAAHVIEHVTEPDLAELERLVERMDGTQDVHEWSDVNWQFHAVVHRVSRRPTTVRILQHLFAQAEPYSRMFLRSGHHLELAQSQHHELVAMIRRGEVEPLAAAMSRHILGALDPLVPIVAELVRRADDAPPRRPRADLIRKAAGA
jgi:DNA-binding GntR family transcriptional regulator